MNDLYEGDVFFNLIQYTSKGCAKDQVFRLNILLDSLLKYTNVMTWICGGFMEKNVDHESKRDLLYVIVIIVLAIIYALLFTLDPLEKNYSQVMVMAILTGLFIIGQLPFIKRRIKRILYLLLILAIQIVIYLIIWMERQVPIAWHE